MSGPLQAADTPQERARRLKRLGLCGDEAARLAFAEAALPAGWIEEGRWVASSGNRGSFQSGCDSEKTRGRGDKTAYGRRVQAGAHRRRPPPDP